MTHIELEQKYVLDLREKDKIIELLQQREGENLVTSEIRQCYHGGYRFRATDTDGETIFLREQKQGISLGTSYSVNVEDPETLSEAEFVIHWSSGRKRLQKTRYEVMLSQTERRSLVVDAFHTGPDKTVYALVAEVEVILDRDTNFLTLDRFTPPNYLHWYILKVVEDFDEQSKDFRSINMIDTPESIGNIERAYRQLYEQSL